MTSKTFCPVPWNSVNFKNNGDSRMCCNAAGSSKDGGVLNKSDGVAFNAGKDDWNDTRNAQLLNEVRLTMISGKWHGNCGRCMKEESVGIKSRRLNELSVYKKDISYIESITDNVTGKIPVDIIPIDNIDIRYGNFCNLKCRMCGPGNSHQWFNDFVSLYNMTSYYDAHNLIQLAKNKDNRWATIQYNWFVEDTKYWDNFKKYAMTAKKLYFVGGEPLIIEEHTKSIQYLVDSGYSSNIIIDYNSNFTVVPKKIIELWEKFKEVRIGVSLDGLGNVLNYQRSPANFNQIYNNIVKVDNNTNINLNGWIACTITVLNVFQYPELIKWKLLDSNLKRFNSVGSLKQTVSYQLCHYPAYYNIKILPPEIKLQLKNHYELYKQWIYDTNFSDSIKAEVQRVLTEVINFMNSEDHTEFLPEFISTTNKLDEIRGEDILSIVPQYATIFKRE